MKRIVFVLLAFLVAASVFGAAPTITTTRDPNAPFLVEFNAGAQWACTIYRTAEPQSWIEPDNPNFPDGHYTPRHCWALDETMTSYPDDWAYIDAIGQDWDVRAEVGYPVAGQDLQYISTAPIRVRH